MGIVPQKVWSAECGGRNEKKQFELELPAMIKLPHGRLGSRGEAGAKSYCCMWLSTYCVLGDGVVRSMLFLRTSVDEVGVRWTERQPLFL